MGIEKKIKIVADTKEAEKSVKSLGDTFDELTKKAENIEKQLAETTDPKKIAFLKKQLEGVNNELGVTEKKTETVAKKGSKGFKGMGAAVKGVGLAFKALGIGLIVALVAKLTEAFGKNQKIANAVSTVFETIGIVFNQVFDALVNVYESVTESSDRFNALKTVITEWINIGLTPLKLILDGIKLLILESQLAWEKSFFGDKDPKSILELNEAIKQTQEDIKQTAEDAVESGKAIVDNFSEAITEIGEIGSQVINEISEISIKNAADQAKQLVELRNAARLAIAENELILKTKQKEAELQRQIRDNVELDIETRKKANDELLKILEEANDLRIANAQKVVDLAKAELAANKGSIEAQEALITAQKDYQDVLETTSGFISEQKTNEASLNNELIELENSRLQAVNDRALAQKEFDAEQQKTELEKIQKQKEALKDEEKLIEEDLQRKLAQFKEGTQARQDAEQEALTKQQEVSNKRIALDRAEANEKIKIEKAVTEAKAKIRDQNLDNVVGGFKLLASLDEENKALQAASLIAENATGIAKNIINTNAANGRLTLETGVAAPAAIAANNIRMGIGIAASVAATAKGLAALGKGGGGTSASLGADAGGGGASAPSFNLVQGTGTNQIAETLQEQREPLQAYVVSSDVTSAQSLDRNIVDNATL